MNCIFAITDRVDDMVLGFLSSAAAHNNCKIFLNIVGPNPSPLRPAWHVRLFPVSAAKWSGQRMYRKIACLSAMPFNDGDKVLVLDTDLIVQGELFGAMEGADIFVTTRHYPYWYVCNGGVWGFIYGPRTRQFLSFFAQQFRQPTWEPLKAFQDKWMPLRGEYLPLDWWGDQDMLCVIYGQGCPGGATVRDLGPKYNWCPSAEEGESETFVAARADILSKVGDSEYKILHFKGRLKDVYRREVQKR